MVEEMKAQTFNQYKIKVNGKEILSTSDLLLRVPPPKLGAVRTRKSSKSFIKAENLESNPKS
jgi:hypothetical protein